MEIERLISALEEILVDVRNSESSYYAHESVAEIIEKLEAELAKATNSQSIDAASLSYLFAPTGAIQEVALDNGWGKEFLRISQLVDQFAGDRK